MQKTAYEMRISDWSSDVCSSDLIAPVEIPSAPEEKEIAPPSEEALEAAAAISENERAAFITSMVDRLAERLAATPDDFHGWMRLGQAYRVLGDRAAALRA